MLPGSLNFGYVQQWDVLVVRWWLRSPEGSSSSSSVCVSCRAENIFQMMKSRFGVHNCHLLHINSSSSSVDDGGTNAGLDALPNPWSRFVSRKRGLDVSFRIRGFPTKAEKLKTTFV